MKDFAVGEIVNFVRHLTLGLSENNNCDIGDDWKEVVGNFVVRSSDPPHRRCVCNSSLLVIVVQEMAQCLGCAFCLVLCCDFGRMREIRGKLYPSKSVDELFFRRGENTDFYHLQNNSC